MNPETFDAVREVLVSQFEVDPAQVAPESTLEGLGLDSLALMEFVFAMEDRFDVRIPEDRLDPRQAGTTLAMLSTLLEEAKAQAAASPASPAATLAGAPMPAPGRDVDR